MKLLSVVLMLIMFSTNVFAHGGELNSDGCHNDDINGGYHCHNGSSGSGSSSSDSSISEESVTPRVTLLTVLLGSVYMYKVLTEEKYSAYEAKTDPTKYVFDVDFDIESENIVATVVYRF